MILPVKRNANGNRIGDSHHRAKLTDHEVTLARQMFASRLFTVCQLAEKFGMSKGGMSKILRGVWRP